MAKRGRARRRPSGRDYRQELAFAADARHVPDRQLRGLLGWMRRRPGKPRVFWALDPATGEWRRV